MESAEGGAERVAYSSARARVAKAVGGNGDEGAVLVSNLSSLRAEAAERTARLCGRDEQARERTPTTEKPGAGPGATRVGADDGHGRALRRAEKVREALV